MAFSTDAAESRDTSCSPLRPPNRIPTRSFFITFFRLDGDRGSRQSQQWFETCSSQDLLSKGRQRQFDRETRRPVVFVDDGIHLDDLEAQHTPVVCDDLHVQVRFALGAPAAYRRAHP